MLKVIPPTFDRLWPFLRHPQLALPSWNFEWLTKGGPSTHCHEGGVGNMFRSESFPS